MLKSILLFISLTIFFSSNLISQTNSPCPCCSENFRQFDFWLGEWNVYSGVKLLGSNSIQLIQDSCIIQENWIGAKSNFTGTSFSFYNKKKDQWQQLWIDNRGGNLELSGGLSGNKMILTSASNTNANGDQVSHRVSWTNNPDGTVRQFWESTKDGGATWNSLFDGLYKKKIAN